MDIVYRLVDRHGELLYVGITNDFSRRMFTHAMQKSWWPDVATIAVEHARSREDAALREREYIAMQRPIYNITMNVDPRMPGEPRGQQSHKPPFARGDLVGLVLASGRVEIGLIEHVTEAGSIVLAQDRLERIAFDSPAILVDFEDITSIRHLDHNGAITWTVDMQADNE